jgi:CMP-N-acetylneuraminic acid synthetase
MNVVAFVPIKFHSERLPGKNLLPLQGKPLCWHIFETLLACDYIDDVYVYCSEKRIKNYIPREVLFKKRSAALDINETKGMDIYQNFVKEVDADLYVLAHATSPFLRATSIDAALQQVMVGKHDSACSTERIQTFCWYQGKPLNYDLIDVPRTQDIEPVYAETSGFFIFTKELIKKNRRLGTNVWMQEVDRIEAIDIDEEKDYEFAKRVKK